MIWRVPVPGVTLNFTFMFAFTSFALGSWSIFFWACCCAFWIATGWPDGATAPIFAAVLGSLLAGVDDPLPTFRYRVFLAVIAIEGIYTFGVLPRITTLEM